MESGGGKNPEIKRVCVHLEIMPAKCSMIWPHEDFCQILEIFLVNLIHIFREVEWWWWWSIW
jgi:hypothetical protein